MSPFLIASFSFWITLGIVSALSCLSLLAWALSWLLKMVCWVGNNFINSKL